MTTTLTIIKPDAFGVGNAGKIIAHLEGEGFRIRSARVVHLTRSAAESFYAVHAERPFFDSLVSLMTSGPCMPLVLEADNAIARWRETMGATDPAQAADGTLRKLFATNIERNACHGSDAPETAAVEVAYFFPGVDLRG